MIKCIKCGISDAVRGKYCTVCLSIIVGHGQ